MLLFFLAGFHWYLGADATTPKSWVVWGSLDATEVHWTATTCETVSISPNDDAPSNSVFPDGPGNGIRALILYGHTHELLWLQGSALFRSWLDKTNTRQLAEWSSDFFSKGGALAMHAPTLHTESPALLVADTASATIYASIVARVPPRYASDVSTWTPVINASNNTLGSQPVLQVQDGWLYFAIEAVGLRRVRVADLIQNAYSLPMDGKTAGEFLVPAQGSPIVSVVMLRGYVFWLTHAVTQGALVANLNMISLSMADASLLENSSYWDENVNTIHTYPAGDTPHGLVTPSLQQQLAAAVPVSSPGAIGEELFVTVAAPTSRARLQRMVIEFKDEAFILAHAPEDFCWMAGLERRGGAIVAPSSLAVYTMPTMCLSVACIYLEVFGECKETCADSNNPCQTCYLDTMDWVMRTWVPQASLFSGCVWLFPPLEATGLLRAQVHNAKLSGLLPDNFTDVVVPPQLEPSTLPPTSTTLLLTSSTRPFTTLATTSMTASRSRVATSTRFVTTTTTTASTTPPTIADSQNISTTTLTTVTMPPTIAASPGVESKFNTCTERVREWCVDNERMMLRNALDRNDASTMDVSTLPDALVDQCQGLWSSDLLCQTSLANGRIAEKIDQVDNSFPWLYILLVGVILVLLTVVAILCRGARRRDQSIKSAKASLVSAAVVDASATGPPSSLRSIGHTFSDESDSGALLLGDHSMLSDDGVDLHSSWSRWPNSKYQLQLPSEASTCDEESQCISSNRTTATCNIAGRLTHAMRRAMGKGVSEEERWQWVDDVEDILQVLGGDLPCDIQESASDWLSRHKQNLACRDKLSDATDEAFTFAAQISNSLDQRMSLGLQEAEVVAISGALFGVEESANDGASSKYERPPEDHPISETKSSAFTKGSSKDALAMSAMRATGLKEDFQTQRRRLLQNAPDLRNATGLEQLLAFGNILDAQRNFKRLATIPEEGLEECRQELNSRQSGSISRDRANDDINDEAWVQLLKELRELQNRLAAEVNDGTVLDHGDGELDNTRALQQHIRDMQDNHPKEFGVSKDRSSEAARMEEHGRARTKESGSSKSFVGTRSFSATRHNAELGIMEAICASPQEVSSSDVRSSLRNRQDELLDQQHSRAHASGNSNMLPLAHAWGDDDWKARQGISSNGVGVKSSQSGRMDEHVDRNDRFQLSDAYTNSHVTKDGVDKHAFDFSSEGRQLSGGLSQRAANATDGALDQSGQLASSRWFGRGDHIDRIQGADANANSQMVSDGFDKRAVASSSSDKRLAWHSGMTNASAIANGDALNHALDRDGASSSSELDKSKQLERMRGSQEHTLSNTLRRDDQDNGDQSGSHQSCKSHELHAGLDREIEDGVNSGKGNSSQLVKKRYDGSALEEGSSKQQNASEERRHRGGSDVGSHPQALTGDKDSDDKLNGGTIGNFESKGCLPPRRLSFRDLMDNASRNSPSALAESQESLVGQRRQSASGALSAFLAQRKHSKEVPPASTSSQSMQMGDLSSLSNEAADKQSPSSSSTALPSCSRQHSKSRWADDVDETESNGNGPLPSDLQAAQRWLASFRDKISNARSHGLIRIEDLEDFQRECDAAIEAYQRHIGDPSGIDQNETDRSWRRLARLWQKLQQEQKPLLASKENLIGSLSQANLQSLPSFMQRALSEGAEGIQPQSSEVASHLGKEACRDETATNDLLVEAARRASLFEEELKRQLASLKRRQEMLRSAMAKSSSRGAVEKSLAAGAFLEDQRMIAKLESEIANASSDCQKNALTKADLTTTDAWQELLKFWGQQAEHLQSLRRKVELQDMSVVDSAVAEMFRKLLTFKGEIDDERAQLQRVSTQCQDDARSDKEEPLMVAGQLNLLQQTLACLQDLQAQCLHDSTRLQHDSQSSGNSNSVTWNYLVDAWTDVGLNIEDLLNGVRESFRALPHEAQFAAMSEVNEPTTMHSQLGGMTDEGANVSMKNSNVNVNASGRSPLAIVAHDSSHTALQSPMASSSEVIQREHKGDFEGRHRSDGKILEETFSRLSESLGIDVGTCAQSSQRRLRPSVFVSDADIEAALREARRRQDVFDENLKQQRLQIRSRDRNMKGISENGEESTCDSASRVSESDQMDAETLARMSRRLSRPGVFISDAEKQAALREARRCSDMFAEDLSQQRLRIRRRHKQLESQEAGLERLIEAHCVLEDLAEEHISGLKDCSEKLEEALENDCGEIDEIEAWRQLAGLHDLEAARARTQRRLSSQGHAMTSEELLSAQAQCSAMQNRLAKLKAEEEELQQQRLQKRKAMRGFRNAHIPDDLPEQTRALLQKAHQQALASEDESSEALYTSSRWDVETKQELCKLRDKCVIEASTYTDHEILPSASSANLDRSSSAASDKMLKSEDDQMGVARIKAGAMRKRLASAIGGIEERADWIAGMSKDLFKDLEAAFSARRDCGRDDPAVSSEIGEEVVSIVERWRQRLAPVPERVPSQPLENERWTEALSLVQTFAECATTTCSSSTQASADNRRDRPARPADFSDCREGILKSWKNRLDAYAEGEAAETKRQHEAMQLKIMERRRKRERENASRKDREKKRVTAPSRELSQVSQVEVRRRTEDAESAAKSVLKQFHEEAEQQARSVLRKAEARKQRLAMSARNFTKTLKNSLSPPSQDSSDPFMTTASSSTTWAWSKTRTAIDVSNEPGFPMQDDLSNA